MTQYRLLRIPTNKNPYESAMYQGEDNTWTHFKSKAKIFDAEMFMPPNYRYNYKFERVVEQQA